MVPTASLSFFGIITQILVFLVVSGSRPALSGQLSKCVFDQYSDAVVRTVYRYNQKSKAPGETRGSGFLIQESGLILTANHNLRPVSEEEVSSFSVKVQFQNSRIPDQDAEVRAQDEKADVALLKIHTNKDPWPTLPIGKLNTKWNVGDLLAGLGYPDGGDLSLIDDAHITSLNATVDGVQMPWWRTDLLLNHGDSGGPIFGKDGKVRALAIAKDDNAQGISFVLPLTEANKLLEGVNLPETSSSKCGDALAVAPAPNDCELNASISWDSSGNSAPLYIVLTAGNPTRYLVDDVGQVALRIPSANVDNWSLALVWSDNSQSTFGTFSGCSFSGRKESEDKRVHISFHTF